jgi:hypothetical protein
MEEVSPGMSSLVDWFDTSPIAPHFRSHPLEFELKFSHNLYFPIILLNLSSKNIFRTHNLRFLHASHPTPNPSISLRVHSHLIRISLHIVSYTMLIRRGLSESRLSMKYLITCLLAFSSAEALAHRLLQADSMATNPTTAISSPSAKIDVDMQENRHKFSMPTIYHGSSITSLPSVLVTEISTSYVTLVTRYQPDYEERKGTIRVVDHENGVTQQTLVTRASIAPPAPSIEASLHYLQSRDDLLNPTQSLSPYNLANQDQSTIANHLYISSLADYCHDGLSTHKRYTYFTLIHPNGTQWTSDSHTPLLFLNTQWHLSYPSTLRRTLFNDSTVSDGCPLGYCYSSPIPGTESLILKHVTDPATLRNGDTGVCRYQNLLDVWHRQVELASVGDYRLSGVVAPQEVLSFVQNRVRDTFPVLEIALILVCTLWIPASMVLCCCCACCRKGPGASRR